MGGNLESCTKTTDEDSLSVFFKLNDVQSSSKIICYLLSVQVNSTLKYMK